MDCTLVPVAPFRDNPSSDFQWALPSAVAGREAAGTHTHSKSTVVAVAAGQLVAVSQAFLSAAVAAS